MQRLFGVGLHTRLVCEESGEAIEEDSMAYELKCNITADVNHLAEGIRLGLQDDREKNSEALGRLALFKARRCTLKYPKIPQSKIQPELHPACTSVRARLSLGRRLAVRLWGIALLARMHARLPAAPH